MGCRLPGHPTGARRPGGQDVRCESYHVLGRISSGQATVRNVDDSLCKCLRRIGDLAEGMYRDGSAQRKGGTEQRNGGHCIPDLEHVEGRGELTRLRGSGCHILEQSATGSVSAARLRNVQLFVTQTSP